MNKTIITLLLFLSLTISVKAQQDDMYCKGFTVGFYDGYCYSQFPCYKPDLLPCPEKPNNNSTYVDGYKIGFHRGRIESIMNK